jgi:hypothetical protein
MSKTSLAMRTGMEQTNQDGKPVTQTRLSIPVLPSGYFFFLATFFLAFFLAILLTSFLF